jgi:hypothetical protein
MEPSVVNVTTPEQPAPVVNVTATAAEQPAPVVNVNVPEQRPIINVPKPEVTFMPSVAKASDSVQDVRIVESTLPPRKRVVKRDFHGRIEELTEE